MQHGLDPISRTKMRVLDVSSLDVQGNIDIDLHNVRLPLIPPRNEGFDPRKCRNPLNPIKPWMAFFNMIRSVFGTGALGLPLAISQVGFVVGPLMMLFTACLLIHTQQCLLWCLNECSRQLRIPYVNYRFGFRLTLLHGPECLAKWGDYGPNIVGVIMVITQISICTVFVLFTADSLRDIADFQSSSTALGWLLVPYLLMAIAMKNLKIISYISMLGNIMNIIGMTLTFVQIFREPHGKMVPAVLKPVPLLFAFGTMLFNMSTIAVVIMMDRSLKNPYLLLGKTGMICVGNSTSTFVGTIFGVLGYWSFGTMEENILRSLPFDDPLSLSAISIYMLSIAFTYPLQCYPGLYIISQMIRDRGSGDGPPTDSFMSVVEIVSRPIFVLVSFFIGYLIPFQGAFVAFVGNLCTTLLAIVFPAVMELCLRYPNNYGRMKFYLIKDIIFILIGFFTWISGIVFSGTLIYIRILAMNSPNRQM